MGYVRVGGDVEVGKRMGKIGQINKDGACWGKDEERDGIALSYLRIFSLFKSLTHSLTHYHSHHSTHVLTNSLMP